jgi:PleD family two-component response regulator
VPAPGQRVEIKTDPNNALFLAAGGNYDLIIVSRGPRNFAALATLQPPRSIERTRNSHPRSLRADNRARMVRGFAIGANDYLPRPIDKNELLARTRCQIRERRCSERLRALTGVFNRRTWIEQANSRGKPLTALVLAIDWVAQRVLSIAIAAWPGGAAQASGLSARSVKRDQPHSCGRRGPEPARKLTCSLKVGIKY